VVTVRFECRPRPVQGLLRPAQIARGERNLDLRNDAPRTGHDFFRAEGAGSTAQKSLRPNQIAELRHRDASKSESRRVVAQGHPLQRPKGITR
jgi:hypothetical protein